VAPPPRLLIGLPPDPSITGAVERALPGVPFVFVADRPERPYRGIEALLVGNLERVLPGLSATDVPDLKFVQTLYTGLDGFPFDRMPPRTRVAGNVGGYAPFVAEHAIALLLASAHDLMGGQRALEAGELRPTSPMVYLGGKTALLVGYGAIASEIARRLAAFGTRCWGVNRSGAPRPGVERMFPERELARALGEADVVIDCLPLTRATRGRFDGSLLAAMRPTAIFVNVGRAETVDAEAFRAHLERHPDFRAALDVWWGEDFLAGRIEHPFPIAGRPNLMGSPHRAGLVPEARPYVLERALENLARFFAGEEPRYVADPAEYLEPTGGAPRSGVTPGRPGS
jgi:phosphoglycerate dehydrogenase-like enzyme